MPGQDRGRGQRRRKDGYGERGGEQPEGQRYNERGGQQKRSNEPEPPRDVP